MLRASKRVLCGAAAACLLFASPAHSAQEQHPSVAKAGYTELKPGKFIWHPQAAKEGSLEIVVSLPLQAA